MGLTSLPQKVKFFCGVIYNGQFNIQDIRNVVEDMWGGIDIASDPIPFLYTDYYDKEMGTPLWRQLWSFNDLVDRDVLAARKLESNILEKKYSINKNRPVNLDPGYLTLGQLI